MVGLGHGIPVELDRSCDNNTLALAKGARQGRRREGLRAMRLATFVCSALLLLASLVPAKADEKTASGSAALALAALVGINSPLLDAKDKETLGKLLDGVTDIPAGRSISVLAESLTCRASNIAIAEHSCELKFGSSAVALTGRKAHELFATLIETGIEPEGAAGSVYAAATKLDCSIDPAELKQNSGGGASCRYLTAD